MNQGCTDIDIVLVIAMATTQVVAVPVAGVGALKEEEHGNVTAQANTRHDEHDFAVNFGGVE